MFTKWPPLSSVLIIKTLVVVTLPASHQLIMIVLLYLVVSLNSCLGLQCYYCDLDNNISCPAGDRTGTQGDMCEQVLPNRMTRSEG